MTDRRILLVEDNPDDRLDAPGVEETQHPERGDRARDGAEALTMLLGDHGDRARPALVLLDLKLPKVDGLEVLRRIRAADHTAHVPVVILTSSKEQEDILNSDASGANAYVRKPVNFSEFADAVSTLGMFWLLLNETVPDSGAPLG